MPEGFFKSSKTPPINTSAPPIKRPRKLRRVPVGKSVKNLINIRLKAKPKAIAAPPVNGIMPVWFLSEVGVSLSLPPSIARSSGIAVKVSKKAKAKARK